MDWALQLIASIFFAGATYGAIRMDLRNIHKELEHHDKAIGEAHERIDSILLGRKR